MRVGCTCTILLIATRRWKYTVTPCSQCVSFSLDSLCGKQLQMYEVHILVRKKVVRKEKGWAMLERYPFQLYCSACSAVVNTSVTITWSNLVLIGVFYTFGCTDSKVCGTCAHQLSFFMDERYTYSIYMYMYHYYRYIS